MKPAASPQAAAAAAPPRVPYRGIESFRYVDQRIFFVRKDETQSLRQLIALYRGVLLYGESGTGKSSLVNAGLIPAAIADGYTPDRLRIQPRLHEEIIVERLPITADAGPPYLPSTFAAGDDTAARVVLSVNAFLNTLRFPGDSRPLLIFDQFEEFVTLFEEAASGPAVAEARQTQRAVLDMLVELLRDRVLPVKVLLVFREDYLAKLSKLFALCPDLPDQCLRLLPPRIAVLPEIIRGPFVAFPNHFQREISEGLAAQVAAAIVERSELGKLNLSEVQIACLRLWQARDPDALFVQTGIGGLLEDYLGAALYRLDAGLRDPARALLSRMVTTSGTRNVISGENLISLTHNEERLPEELLKEALDALESETKLVRREHRHNTYFYEIVSEFLIPWISRQREERAQERLAEAERRKKTRAYAIAAALAIFAIVVSVIALVMVRKNEEAAAKGRKLSETEGKLGKVEQELDNARRKLKDVEAETASKAQESERYQVDFTTSNEFLREADAEREAWRRWAGTVESYFPLNGVPLPVRPKLESVARRQGVTVSYEQGWIKAPSVAGCWKAFDFNLDPKPGYTRPNRILCGAKVEGEDLKKVMLCLLRAEAKITEIAPLGQASPVIRVESSGTKTEPTYTLGMLSDDLELQRLCKN